MIILTVLFACQKEKAPVTVISHKGWITYNQSNGLAGNFVNSIAFDKNGNTWIGTNKGLSMFDGDKWTIYNSKNGLIDDYVYFVIVDKKGYIWVGTEDGISKFDNISWTSYNRFILNLGVLVCAAVDSNNNKWFGAGYNGQQVVKFDDTKWTIYKKDFNGFWGNLTYAIAVDAKNIKWILTDNGINSFDDSNWNWYIYVNYLGAQSITIDSHDNKFFGTSAGGVWKFDNLNWIYYGINHGLNIRPGYNSVRCAAIDLNGNQWFSNGSGVAKLDSINWTIYSVKDGLADSLVNTIAIDKNNNKWFGTNYGVTKLENGY